MIQEMLCNEKIHGRLHAAKIFYRGFSDRKESKEYRPERGKVVYRRATRIEKGERSL